MSGDVKHICRQIYYRFCKWQTDPVYTVFSKMYALDNTPWPTVHRHPNKKHFILADFIMPLYKDYSGREIAVFNGQQVAVYWMPGASHSAGGYVKPGEHFVKLNHFTLKKPIYLAIRKTDEKTSIDSISLSPTTTYFSSNGGFIPYSAIIRELTALMIQWLNVIETNWEHYCKKSNFSKNIHIILNLCSQLPDKGIQSQANNLAHLKEKK